MMQLVLGLMAGDSPTNISKTMSEIRRENRIRREAEEKAEAEMKLKREENYKKQTALEESIGDKFDEYNDRCRGMNDPATIFEPVINCLDYTLDEMKIDKINFLEIYKKHFDEYWRDDE